MYTVVGLGNPGEKYENTRHNVGRIALDTFMLIHSFPSMKKSNNAHAFYTWSEISGVHVEVIYPDMYMNQSGQSVRYAVDKHDVLPEQIVVVHDDVSLPLGKIKVSLGRGDGGHKGVTSIIDALGTKDFIRIRVGIAQESFFGGMKKHTGSGLSHFVLKKFSKKEKKTVDEVSQKVNVALVHIFENGVHYAMQECN